LHVFYIYSKSLKRALPADAEGDESMADADTSKVSIDSSKLSKNQRKKLAKKMKGENGESVPTLIPEVNVTETKEVKTTADGKKETTTTTEVKEVKEGKKKDQAKGAADKKGDAQPKDVSV
jgi:FK506-binding nuclear protein